MTIERLIAAVPPPAAPFEAFNGPWEPVEAQLGIALPPDYKDFARLYGSGYFMQFMGVYIPRCRNPNGRLEYRLPLTCESFLQMQTLESPYPFWPQPGGLLPFGVTDNGDDLFWLSRGPPTEWRVVVWDGSLMGPETLDCDLTDFLAGLATGEILPRDFPRDMLPNECLFKPHSA